MPFVFDNENVLGKSHGKASLALKGRAKAVFGSCYACGDYNNFVGKPQTVKKRVSGTAFGLPKLTVSFLLRVERYANVLMLSPPLRPPTDLKR
jgi:hypothetical protein